MRNPALQIAAVIATTLSLLQLGACQTSTTKRTGVTPPTAASVAVVSENLPSVPSEPNDAIVADAPTNEPALAQPTQTQESSDTVFIPTRPTQTGELQHPALYEVSGLSASKRYPNTLWAINDSGNEATLYAFDIEGKTRGSFPIAAKNRDWEDLGSATINGEPYLLIGDIGDNLQLKTEHDVHIIAEPLLDQPAVDALQPIHTLRYRYPDQAHNAEALAYTNGFVYVLTKAPLANGQRQASQVFRIPLDFNAGNETIQAEQVATLSIPRNSIEASLIASIGGVDVSQPTALAFDQQNRVAYVLTYRSVYRYQREPEQTWAEVLAKPRVRIHSHSLSQAEALTVDGQGVVWFTSEKKPAPLWALPNRLPDS